jgi:hypothetical protein
MTGKPDRSVRFAWQRHVMTTLLIQVEPTTENPTTFWFCLLNFDLKMRSFAFAQDDVIIN